jgi:hypothetical protein
MEVKTKIVPKTRDEFMQAITEFAQNVGKDLHDVMIQQAGLACFDAMRFTPPLPKGGKDGLSKKAEKTGEGAVKRDIGTIAVAIDDRKASKFMFFRAVCNTLYAGDRGQFTSLMKKYAGKAEMSNNVFYKIAADSDQNRAFSKAKNLFSKYVPRHSDYGTDHIVQDIDAIHERILKTKNGRIVRNGGPGFNWLNKYLVQSKANLQAYIKKKQAEVGKLKAGWAGAMKGLPPMKGKQIKRFGGKVPTWISRHGVTQGYTVASMSNYSNLSIKVGNSIGDNDNVATDADVPNIVYGNRVKQMHAELEKYFIRNAEKFNNK